MQKNKTSYKLFHKMSFALNKTFRIITSVIWSSHDNAWGIDLTGDILKRSPDRIQHLDHM